jgi:basic amino acid/polyamine antiporter, APA family
MQSSLFRKKDIYKVRDVNAHDNLEKVLGPIDLLAIGIGALMGTGIFVLTGVQAAQFSGPAVIISLAIAAMAAMFIGLVYTEVASAVPSSGGSYTYTYVSLGEMIAFMVGWLYLLYCLCAIPAVASGWGGYLVGILDQFHIHLPEALTKTPFEEGGMLNVPAMAVCLLMMLILLRGVKESATLNIILVFIKLFAAFLFIALAFPHFKFSNWSDFMPFGFKGVSISAGVLFFAYNGFDAVANAAEECKNPTRDITIGLIGSLIICAIVYILIAVMLTGIVHYTKLNTPEALAYALKVNGSNIGGAIVAAGGIAGMTTVILFQLYSVTRILMAMSRDRLLPVVFSKIHKKYHTPHIATIFCGILCSLVAGLFPLDILGSLTSLSVLIVLMVVMIAAMRLRKTRPTIKRPFRCPAIYFIATMAIICCLYLLVGLVQHVGNIFVWFLVAGFLVYFTYSKKKVDRCATRQGVKK